MNQKQKDADNHAARREGERQAKTKVDLDRVEAEIRKQLALRLPKRAVKTRLPLEDEGRALYVDLFTSKVQKQTKERPTLTIRIIMTPSQVYGRPAERSIKLDGPYGEGVRRTYKLGDDLSFNPALFETIEAYAHEREARALRALEERQATDRVEALMVPELESWARRGKHSGWFYRGHYFYPKARGTGRVKIDKVELWPDEIKTYLDLFLDFEEACDKLGKARG